ncbi:MAG: hypothetical protein ACHQ51_05335 [Elusimicrobiota bacterium]
MRILMAAALAALLAPAAGAGLLSPGSVAVLDANSAPRTTFSNNERITFQQRVFNGVASPNRVSFTFIVLSPSGANVFQIAGNAVPGSVGNAATQLSGFPIAKFYTGPGTYTLQALASLDGQVVSQQATFIISSPNILLLYPPNGAQNVADVPLTFRWVSSGGSTYRLTVGDNPSFFNALFAQQTGGAETFLSYPLHPSDQRLILSAGQIYYWKVEALDGNGQVVGASSVPNSFTVQTAALGRDMAVTDLSVQGGQDLQGNIPFKVTVANQGGTAQANVPLRFSVGGLAAVGTPVSMAMIGPGETRDYAFSAPLPPGQTQSLGIACVDFSDDNLTNNCKTLQITQASASGGTTNFTTNVSADQVWQQIQDLLRQQGMDLSEYNLVGMEGQLSADDLKSLLASLRTGAADVSLSGPTLGGGAAAIVPAVSTASFNAPASAPRQDVAPAAPNGVVADEEETAPLGSEWEGFSAPMSSRPSGQVISDEKTWKKIWRLVQTGRVPKVNFNEHIVVAVFAGKGEKADHAEIQAVEMSLSGLVVRYQFVRYATFNVNSSPRAAVPYRMRVVPRTTVPVQFDLVEEKEDVPAKPKSQERK